MTSRRDILRASLGLLLPSTALADEFVFTPIPKPPKPTPKVKQREPHKYTLSDFRLDLHTADWCRYCRIWEASEESKVDCKVNHVSGGAASLPTFRLRMLYRGKWRHVERGKSTANGVRHTSRIEWQGYTSAEKINAELRRQIRIRNGQATGADSSDRQIIVEQSPRPSITQRPKSNTANIRWRSQAELRQWIRRNYTPNTSTRHATVQPRSFVWQHLQGTHRFRREQVQGLSQWEALALHSGAHRGTIGPIG